MAEKAFSDMNKMLKNLSMTMKDLRRKLDAAEMWLIRRMLRISWAGKVTNEEVLTRVGLKGGIDEKY